MSEPEQSEGTSRKKPIWSRKDGNVEIVMWDNSTAERPHFYKTGVNAEYTDNKTGETRLSTTWTEDEQLRIRLLMDLALAEQIRLKNLKRAEDLSRAA